MDDELTAFRAAIDQYRMICLEFVPVLATERNALMEAGFSAEASEAIAVDLAKQMYAKLVANTWKG